MIAYIRVFDGRSDDAEKLLFIEGPCVLRRLAVNSPVLSIQHPPSQGDRISRSYPPRRFEASEEKARNMYAGKADSKRPFKDNAKIFALRQM